MHKPTRPPNTPPFVEPAFYIDHRQLAQHTVEAAKAKQVKDDAQKDVKQTRSKKV